MWLPPVITSTPAARISATISRWMPKPPAAFSPLATTQSTARGSRQARVACIIASRPGRPTESPQNKSRRHPEGFGGTVGRGNLLGELTVAGLPDDGDLDVARIGHFVLDALGDLPGQGGGFGIRHRLGLDHHPQL